MASDKAKERFTPQTYLCEHCGNRSRMLIVAEYDEIETDEYGWDSGPAWELLRCTGCDNVSLRKTIWHDGMDSEDIKWTIIYPKEGSRAIKGLPAKITSAWTAAQQVRRIDANAFAVLVRRLIEMVAQDQGAQGKTLASKLRDLATKETIPGPLADIAEHIKDFGNIGAHADARDLRENEAALLHELCVAILEYVYAAPELVGRAQAALKKYERDKAAASPKPSPPPQRPAPTPTL
jgi:Domain of unknown function (DUF4145)